MKSGPGSDVLKKGVMPVHHFKRRTERTSAVSLRLAGFCLLLLLGLMPAAGAVESPEEPAPPSEEIQATVETLLRNYQEAAMLYEPRDLRTGTVLDPALPAPEEPQTFLIGEEEVPLEQLGDNLIFLEKKAVFHALMRQLQGIYRQELQLFYHFGEPKITDNVCRISVKETEQFRYTDSQRLSVNETFYTVRLVKLEDRWLIADVTDGSRFDKLYKSQGAAFDEYAALSAFSASLEQEGCAVSFPYAPSGDTAGRTLYNGANAAAYAYTYSRLEAGTPRSEFYNPRFYRYDGEGGDCQNFASQCMWAGFGGSQMDAAIRRAASPMDASGDYQWFGRAASGGPINYSWVSCKSFRKYLTGTEDGTGPAGSNAAEEPGMYATILDVSAGSALTGASPEELVGAVAHVEGSGGSYSHAIVLTAAAGNRRSEIWYCGHTKDVSHMKLGDYYIWPMKVYIPRYMRQTSAESLQVERLQPVEAGTSAPLAFQCQKAKDRLIINVTPPGGVQTRAAASYGTDHCQTEYLFSEPGLYQIECAAKDSAWTIETYYVRCYAPSVPEIDDAPAENPEENPVWDDPTEAIEASVW